jgi:hypothetical protein
MTLRIECVCGCWDEFTGWDDIESAKKAALDAGWIPWMKIAPEQQETIVARGECRECNELRITDGSVS